VSGPGLTTCGTNGNESCCISPLVAGGPISRTYQNTGSGATGKADPATVSAFRLDKYEITVARFRQYVKYLSGGGSPPTAGSGKHTHLNSGKGLADSGNSGAFEPGWDAAWNGNIPNGANAATQWNTQLKCNKYGTWTDAPGANELLPLTCLNWWESHAFCIWDGGFLPSEAEWRFAAAGGDEHRMYPWGSTNPGADSQYAIYDCCYPDKQCKATGGPECSGFVNAAPVGFATLGAGRYGQLDLVGSVFEWLVDRYANYVSPCEDCAYFGTSSTNRVLPGGGFRTTLTPYLQSSNRSAVSYAESFRGDYAVGARCGRAP
jgi:formylglycine-generating enzyme